MLKEPTNCSWVRVRQQLAGYRKTLRARRNFTGLRVVEINRSPTCRMLKMTVGGVPRRIRLRFLLALRPCGQSF